MALAVTRAIVVLTWVQFYVRKIRTGKQKHAHGA